MAFPLRLSYPAERLGLEIRLQVRRAILELKTETDEEAAEERAIDCETLPGEPEAAPANHHIAH
jgi:hypothetical protein